MSKTPIKIGTRVGFDAPALKGVGTNRPITGTQYITGLTVSDQDGNGNILVAIDALSSGERRVILCDVTLLTIVTDDIKTLNEREK